MSVTYHFIYFLTKSGKRTHLTVRKQGDNRLETWDGLCGAKPEANGFVWDIYPEHPMCDRCRTKAKSMTVADLLPEPGTVEPPALPPYLR
jgi:hypothetical protein